jgi:signal transduction histidine kinase
VLPSHALIAVAALAAGGGAAWLAAVSERQSSPAVAAALALAVGWSYVASGLVGWRQRPDNRLGPVMVAIGFAWFATFLADARDPLPFTIGTAVEVLYLVAFVYLILSFPGGRLTGRVDRILFACAVILGTAVELAWLLFADPGAVFCRGCPENLLRVERNDVLARAILDGQRVAGVLLSLFTAGLLVRRWRRASAPQRRSVAPVLWAGSAIMAVLALSAGNDAFDEPLGEAPAWMLGCVFGALPVAVLTVLLQRQLARGAVAGLVVELGEGEQRADLRAALARALGDPCLELAYWVPASGRYVDPDGAPVELPVGEGARVATVVRRGGEPVAALIHDAALSDDADLVDSVCAAAGLALENERLQAELRARLGELHASRARLVEAAEVERRRLERDLHDGAQQRLVSIAMAVGLAESKLTSDPSAARPILRQAKEALGLALEELRDLGHGIHPGILAERGLPAALEELRRRAGLPVRLDVKIDHRLPGHVEAAGYFVVSEALANVAKHARASEAVVSASCDGRTVVIEVVDDGVGGADVARGSGLRGLRDRVEALGGRLAVSRARAGGTRLRAEIPCA